MIVFGQGNYDEPSGRNRTHDKIGTIGVVQEKKRLSYQQASEAFNDELRLFSYKMTSDTGFAPNPCKEKANDLGGKYVLVSNEFWYFGCTPLPIKDDIEISVNLDDRPAPDGNRTDDVTQAKPFLDFVCIHNQGVNNQPHELRSNGGRRSCR